MKIRDAYNLLTNPPGDSLSDDTLDALDEVIKDQTKAKEFFLDPFGTSIIPFIGALITSGERGKKLLFGILKIKNGQAGNPLLDTLCFNMLFQEFLDLMPLLSIEEQKEVMQTCFMYFVGYRADTAKLEDLLTQFDQTTLDKLAEQRVCCIGKCRTWQCGKEPFLTTKQPAPGQPRNAP